MRNICNFNCKRKDKNLLHADAETEEVNVRAAFGAQLLNWRTLLTAELNENGEMCDIINLDFGQRLDNASPIRVRSLRSVMSRYAWSCFCNFYLTY